MCIVSNPAGVFALYCKADGLWTITGKVMAEDLLPLSVCCFCRRLVEILKYRLNVTTKLQCEKVILVTFQIFWERLMCLISAVLFHKINFLTCTGSWLCSRVFIRFVRMDIDNFFSSDMSRELYRTYWRVAESCFDTQNGLGVQKHWEVLGVLLCLNGGRNPGNSKGLVYRLQPDYFMKLLIYSSQHLCVVQAQSSILKAGIGWQSKVPVMFAKSRNILPLWLVVASLQADRCAEEVCS